MGKITVLSDTLCNQIAAGEVIERPAAVVKELLENSVDAGSRRVAVSLLQGGRKEIRVSDNGSGMNPDDALLSLERHATSKIRSIEDLQAIRSMGFRGEALPSIAAVSRFELITREHDAVSGVHVRIEGGVIRDVKDRGCPAGTIVTVRDLFFNMPVRRKFLRSVDTEMAHVSEQVTRLSMAHPDIHFQLHHDERLQYDFPLAKNFEIRASQVLGAETAGKLVPFLAETGSARLHGLAGPPDFQKASGHSLFVYVNGRAVWDRLIHRAILTAYDSSIPKGRYPVLVLFLEVPSHLVDVNVHPTKREVRFREPGEMLETVRSAIRAALENQHTKGRKVEVIDTWKPTSSRERYPHAMSQYSMEEQVLLSTSPARPSGAEEPPLPVQLKAFWDSTTESKNAREVSTEDPSGGDPSLASKPCFSDLPIIGQLANMYILLQASDGLVLLDQHAAHERIVYEQLARDSRKGISAQRLARSVVVELSPREAVMFRKWLGNLSEIGFEIEAFGGDSFVLQAIPAVLGDYSPLDLIQDLISSGDENESLPQLDMLARLAKTAACHGSVRAGQRLTQEEMRHLLVLLDQTRIPFTCPHGRPLSHKLTFAEIARFFRRA